MSNVPSPGSWQQKALQAVLLLLVIAIGARLVADLVAPLVPALVIIALLITIGRFVMGRRH